MKTRVYIFFYRMYDIWDKMLVLQCVKYEHRRSFRTFEWFSFAANLKA